MTNFKAVSEFNELIGNAKGAATVEQVDRQIQLIESEFSELLKAFDQYKLAIARIEEHGQDGGDIADAEAAVIEIRDGIADVLVTTYGLAHRMGIDADKDMQAVSESNMSKFFIGTESQAQSVEHALTQSLGIKVEARKRGEADAQLDGWPATHFVWAFVSADDSDPERPRGKLLKAPGYKPPVFD